jgi:hypothetical protein
MKQMLQKCPSDAIDGQGTLSLRFIPAGSIRK